MSRIPELDFAEIDLRNPFSITESTLSHKRKSSTSSLNDSFPNPNDLIDDSTERTEIIKKSNRGRKLDNFDYNSKIQEELKKLSDNVPDGPEKKKLIQKIRNRLSANRSRLRLKSEVEYYKEENQGLKLIIADLKEQLDIVNNENQGLKQKLFQIGCLSSPVTPEAEPIEFTRTSPKISKSYTKNVFFIGALIFIIATLGTTTVNRVKMAGTVPLLSFNTQKVKDKKATLSELCRQSGTNAAATGPSRKYLYKLKQKINKKIASITELTKLLPQYKIKDFMTEIVSLNCKFSDNNGSNDIERVFLFDKHVAEEAKKSSDALYVSEIWPLEFIDN